MDHDFPAAHSADTLWYAIDAAGHVGIFYSGEEGHVPAAAGDGTATSEELEEPSNELEAKSGVYFFVYDEDYRIAGPVAPYRRQDVPEHPLHVDQLPPALRKQVSQIVLTGVDFAASELVQPLEQFPCVFWSEGELAYLCSDGKTVRPIPGMEDRFAWFCNQFRKAEPEAAKNLIFEGLEEEPQEKQSGSKRGKNDKKDS